MASIINLMNGADYGVNSFMLFSYLLPRITDDSVDDFLKNSVLYYMENKFPKITCNGVRNLKLIMEEKVNEWNSGDGDKDIFIKLIESLVIWKKTDTTDDKNKDDKDENNKDENNKDEDDKDEDNKKEDDENKEDDKKDTLKQDTFDIKSILKESFSNFSETLIYTKTGEDGNIGKKILKTLNNEVVNVLDLNKRNQEWAKRREDWRTRVGTKIGNVGTKIGNVFSSKKTDENDKQTGGDGDSVTIPSKLNPDIAGNINMLNGMANNINTPKDIGMGMGMDMMGISGNPEDAFSELAASKEEMKALAELAEKFMTNLIHHFVLDENKMYGIFSEKILGIIQESTSSVIAQAKSPEGEGVNDNSEAKPPNANKKEGGGDGDDKSIELNDIELKVPGEGDANTAADTKEDSDDEVLEHKADAGEENPAIIKQNVEDFFTSIMDFLIKNNSELHIMILEILSEKISSIYNSIDEKIKEYAVNKDSYVKFKKNVQYALQKNCNDKP